MGHLARASAIARVLRDHAEVIVVSMASSVAELPEAMGLRVEYIPGRDRNLMPRLRWDRYLRDRLVALIDETGASLLAFDGVVPYPGVIGAREVRPRVKLVWMRRGLWQWKPSRHLLSIQSRLMDQVIEPGDFARVFDTGPTSMRKEALLTSPVSLYRSDWALDRAEARTMLGLHPSHPAVLVQLGTGDDDVNEKMHAALSGLIGWKDLQVVLTKEPTDRSGRSLAPAELNLVVRRHFPLADLLHAFDAAIAAAGYNGVHELLPAGVPTVFIPNIRGTDDQASRARWAGEQGFAILADQSSLQDITNKVQSLQDERIRSSLSEACRELPVMNGNQEVAAHYLRIERERTVKSTFRFHYLWYLFRTQITKRMRASAVTLLRGVAILYRTVFPRPSAISPKSRLIVFSDEIRAKELMSMIKSNMPLEHLIQGSSDKYVERRKEIASRTFRLTDFDSIVNGSPETQESGRSN